jgi:rod shape-determining protein MreD
VAYIHQPQRILLPVSVGYMALTVVLALLFNLLPWRDLMGIPDMVALVIAFWCVHQPRKMGIGAAWLVGLVMDAGNGALLGQHAFAYAFLAFGAIALHRRILWFSLWQQAAHILLLLLATQALMVGVRMVAGGPFPGFLYFTGSLIGAALWPAATFVLLLPQRRPESVDENRPL